jgi:hypothetical protein
VVGSVDTGAAFHVERLHALMPELRLYALVRDRVDVVASLTALGLPAPEYPVLDLPTFRAELLGEVEYLHPVWEELNGEGFDAHRAEQLIELNVQRDLGRLSARLQERASCLG